MISSQGPYILKGHLHPQRPPIPNEVNILRFWVGLPFGTVMQPSTHAKNIKVVTKKVSEKVECINLKQIEGKIQETISLKVDKGEIKAK